MIANSPLSVISASHLWVAGQNRIFSDSLLRGHSMHENTVLLSSPTTITAMYSFCSKIESRILLVTDITSLRVQADRTSHNPEILNYLRFYPPFSGNRESMKDCGKYPRWQVRGIFQGIAFLEALSGFPAVI